MIKLMKYLKRYWYFAIFAPLFMILEVTMDLVLSQYMEKMIDYGIQTENLDNVFKYGGIMVGVLLIGVVCGILSGVFTNLTAFNFSNDLRKDVFKKIMYLSYDQTDNFQTGSLVTRVTNDITQVQNMISMTLRGVVRAASFFILGIVFTLSISSKFGLILAIVLPIEIIILIIFIKIVFPIFKEIQIRLDRVNTVVHENVSGARVVKAFSKEDYEYNRFVNANNDLTDKTLYVSKRSALLMPILMVIVYITQLIIYQIGGESIINASKTFTGDNMIMVGEINQAVTYISMICMAIIMLGMTFTNLAKAYASSSRINEVLDTKLEIEDGQKDKTENDGVLEFKNVSFKYPTSKQNVLNNLSFKLNKGETIAIVGSTGVGKTSLVNLIPRFYDTTEGSVLIDGVDVKDYKLEKLRSIVSICLQKSEMFSGSIADNIKFGALDATDEELKEAADIAQALEFVESKENGFDERVEEKGTSLSGGQKQRLAIARAIIRKPKILIFDDSTSALDLVTEAKLYQKLKEKLKDTTKIMVAQRVATAKNADRIIVLDKGEIVGFDTHENLLKNSFVYQDIYNSQLKKGVSIDE